MPLHNLCSRQHAGILLEPMPRIDQAAAKALLSGLVAKPKKRGKNKDKDKPNDDANGDAPAEEK